MHVMQYDECPAQPEPGDGATVFILPQCVDMPAEEALFVMALEAFFLGVRLMLATWHMHPGREVLCPHCLGNGTGCRGVCDDPNCICPDCDGWGASVDWVDALRRARWTGPEVQS